MTHEIKTPKRLPVQLGEAGMVANIRMYMSPMAFWGAMRTPDQYAEIFMQKHQQRKARK